MKKEIIRIKFLTLENLIKKKIDNVLSTFTNPPKKSSIDQYM